MAGIPAIVAAGQSLRFNNVWGWRVLQTGLDTSQSGAAQFPTVTLNEGITHYVSSLETMLAPPGASSDGDSQWKSAVFTNPANSSAPLIVEVATTAQEAARLGVASGSTTVNVGGAITVNPMTQVLNQNLVNAPPAVLAAIAQGTALPAMLAQQAPQVIGAASNPNTEAIGGAVTKWLPWSKTGAASVLSNTRTWLDVRGWKSLVFLCEGKSAVGPTLTLEAAEYQIGGAAGSGANDLQASWAVAQTFGGSFPADSNGFAGCGIYFMLNAPDNLYNNSFTAPTGRVPSVLRMEWPPLFSQLAFKIVFAGAGTVPIYNFRVWGCPVATP